MQSAVLRLHVVRPSVCLTLVDCDHRLEILEIASSPTPSLFVAKRRSTYSQGNMGEFWGDYRWGTGKSGMLENKSGNISETRKDRGKDTMDGLRKLTNALSTVPSEQKPIKFWEKKPWAYSQGVPNIFRAPIHRAHCAVVFAIAQLSCVHLSSLFCDTLLRVVQGRIRRY